MTRRDLNFVIAKWQRGGELTTILARQQDGAAPRAVARLLQVRRDSKVHVSVQRLPETWTTPDRAGLEISALEQLYSLVLRQQPQALYCLVSGGVPCDAAREGVPHAQVLQALAGLRERAVLQAPAAVPWRVVEIRRAPASSWDADLVGIRATSTQGPLEDLAIHFDRAPHSICTARTRADGVASCRLEDQHADGHQHDHATAVVATFPGDVRPERVLLPTTHVLSTTTGSKPPAFARPMLSPSSPP